MATVGLPIELEQQCLALLSDLIAIPSPSGEEHDVAAVIAERLGAVDGIDVRMIAPANVVATVVGDDAGPRRLFMTHTDTMAPSIMVDPFTAVRLPGTRFGADGDVVRGLGASAPKSAASSMVVALIGAAMRRHDLSGTVQLAAVTKDLKADHAGVKEVAAEMSLEADWAVAGEPSGNRVVVGARGIAHIRVEFSGVPAHCGRPADAVNPLFGLADLLDAIRSADLPVHPDLGRATVAAFEVTSEASPPQSPSSAVLMIDRRTLPSEDTASVVEGMAALASEIADRTPGLSVTATAVRAMHPFAIDADHPFVVAARRTVGDAIGADPGTMSISFSSNAGYTTRELGIPSIGFGPGEITALGPEENVPVDQVISAANAYYALMLMDHGGH